MILDIFNKAVAFLEANDVLVVLIITATEYLKRLIMKQKWYKDWMATLLGFALGFIFAIPATLQGFDPYQYLAHSLGLGFVATGLYKVGSTLAKKANLRSVK